MLLSVTLAPPLPPLALLESEPDELQPAAAASVNIETTPMTAPRTFSLTMCCPFG
jgi:hypothetical protein